MTHPGGHGAQGRAPVHPEVAGAVPRGAIALTAAHPALTVLEITHRADFVPDDSPVVVLDAGRVVASGTARELRADATGPFARLEARV